MNKYLAMGAGSLIGAGIFYVIAAVLVERFLNEEYEENSDVIPEDEIEEVKESWKLEDTKQKKAPTDYTKIYIPDQEAKGDISKLAAKYQPTDEEIKESKPPVVVIDESIPHTITMDEFVANPLHYSQNQLTYYSSDDTLVNSKGVPLANVENLIGVETLTLFINDEPLFVINHEFKALYQIDCVDDSFYKERDPRTKRRKPRKVEKEEEDEV